MVPDVLTAVADLAPRLTAAAARADEDRRLADDTVAAMREAGVCRVARPARYGGGEASIRTHLDVSSAVAALDGGAGWCTALWNGGSWIVSLFPDRAQDDANVAARHGMLTPRVNLELCGSALVGAENTISPLVRPVTGPGRRACRARRRPPARGARRRSPTAGARSRPPAGSRPARPAR